MNKKYLFSSVFFVNGLKRFSKVINGVQSYDSILGDKRLKNKLHYAEAIDAHSSGDIDRLLSIVSLILMSAKTSVYKLPSGVRTISYASTFNNKAELNFLLKKFAPYGGARICEITECQVLNRVQLGEVPDVIDAVKIVTHFFMSYNNLSYSLLHQTVNYVVSYFSFLDTFSRESELLKGIVLSNDHSPIPVALSMVAAQLGLCRVYLQHAEVTNIFPPLDFEYSILRNKKSERIYRDIGVSNGFLHVMSRRKEIKVATDIICSSGLIENSDQVLVGVYPSSIFDDMSMRTLVDKLKKNSSIKQVFIKSHPSVDLTEFAMHLGIEHYTEVPKEPHLAIVGNSSVALDLTLLGHLVIQVFALDSIAEDYYGFHEEGLTGKVSLDELSEISFWKSRFNNDIRNIAIANRLDDELGVSSFEEEMIIRRLLIDLGCVVHPGQSYSEKIARFFNIFPATSSALYRTNKVKSFDDEIELINALNHAFDLRIINLSNCYPFFNFSACNSVTDFWFITKMVEWNGKTLDSIEGESLLNYCRRPEHNSKVLQWMESKLFDLFLRSGLDELLNKFLTTAVKFSIAKASINRKIAFVRKLKNSNNDSELIRHYDYRIDKLTKFDELKIHVQCEIKESGRLLYSDYRKVEDAFMNCANPTLAIEYDSLVRSVYRKLGSRCCYIDVKRKPYQADIIIKCILSRLHDHKPFSLVRLSDGEGYLFSGEDSFFTENDMRNRERHWWGMELDSKTRQKVINAGLITIRNADIIGIPSIYRFLRDSGPKTTSYLQSLQGRGLISVLNGVSKNTGLECDFTDDKANLVLFNCIDNLKQLAMVARKVIVVNGANEGVLKNAFKSLGEVQVIVVPTHNKTVGNNKFVFSQLPLPYHFEEVCSQIEISAVPGALVLVGAGIAGKVFVESARRAGAVGLDLGSAMDELVGAGIHSLH